ncbi:MAG: vitamin B12 dependent-methionine synthase activation domain-containing protein [Bacteroidota bacterium]|nr:vitamin B12 dependent-methionine synthase activation domain-containing protein [Bacteroidota bacterium]
MQSLLKAYDTSIDKSRIRIDSEEMLRILGEEQGVIDTHTTAIVEQYIQECLHVSSPAGAFVLVEALECSFPDKINIRGITFEAGKIINKMLRHSEIYALFLVTAGSGPENLARSLLQEGNYLEGYIADLVASALVDSAADQVEEQVRKFAHSQGAKITNRYSPGYCSWNVEEQQKLFSLFPEGCCGISLSESSLMSPVKSISGIIGIGNDVEYRDYTCEICRMRDCTFRKQKNQ